MRSLIIGSGSHIPERVVRNADFLGHQFHTPDGRAIQRDNSEILQQFEAITGIRERRFAADEHVASDMGADAAAQAIESAGVDPESLDYILFAHNFGDVRAGTRNSDLVPALAARVKSRLRVRNPRCIALDLVFGCPGWLQGVILADVMIRAGQIRRAMVIGADTLSRVADPHDRDSLIYADGAGAVILEGVATEERIGILSHVVRSDTLEHCGMLFMGPSHRPDVFLEAHFLKMEGRKLYKYALSTVAGAIKEALDAADVPLSQVAKVLLHQANGKMDEAMLAALHELYATTPRADVMPMTISWLGNSSVATLPTLLDLIRRGRLGSHRIASGDTLVFGSVGAGMHVNALVYREA
jgi:3-oxoacyl-[acyl-carrier-protein] synthase-3